MLTLGKGPTGLTSAGQPLNLGLVSVDGDHNAQGMGRDKGRSDKMTGFNHDVSLIHEEGDEGKRRCTDINDS